MRRTALILIAAAALASPAGALTQQQLGAVAIAPPPGATLPLGLAAIDAAGRRLSLGEAIGGRPAVFVFADYRCRYLCGPGLTLAAHALAETRLRPGVDYRLIVLGLDPRDSLADAAQFGRERLAGEPGVAGAASLLSADAPAIAAATRALGYRYAWDAQHQAYAHLASAFVLAPDGRLVRALPELQMQAPQLAAAVRAAERGAPQPSLAERLHALCYPFDPTRGAWNAPVQTALRFAGAAMLALGAAAALWSLKRRRAP